MHFSLLAIWAVSAASAAGQTLLSTSDDCAAIQGALQALAGVQLDRISSVCTSVLDIQTQTVSTTLPIAGAPTAAADAGLTLVATSTVTSVVSVVTQTAAVCQIRGAGFDEGSGDLMGSLLKRSSSNPVIGEICNCVSLATPTVTLVATQVAEALGGPDFQFPTPILSVAVATTSVTSTATVQTPCPTPASCENQGMDYTILRIAKPAGSAPGISIEDLAVALSHAPLGRGTTTRTGTFAVDAATQPVYDFTVNTTDMAVAYRGYLFAPQTGTYTFNVTSVNDLLLLWLSDPASTAPHVWSPGNANVVASYNHTSNTVGSGSFSMDLTQGTFYPFGILWANSLLQGGYAVTATAPDGTPLISLDQFYNPWIVGYACPGTTEQHAGRFNTF